MLEIANTKDGASRQSVRFAAGAIMLLLVFSSRSDAATARVEVEHFVVAFQAHGLVSLANTKRAMSPEFVFRCKPFGRNPLADWLYSPCQIDLVDPVLWGHLFASYDTWISPGNYEYAYYAFCEFDVTNEFPATLKGKFHLQGKAWYSTAAPIDEMPGPSPAAFTTDASKYDFTEVAYPLPACSLSIPFLSPFVVGKASEVEVDLTINLENTVYVIDNEPDSGEKCRPVENSGFWVCVNTVAIVPSIGELKVESYLISTYPGDVTATHALAILDLYVDTADNLVAGITRPFHGPDHRRPDGKLNVFRPLQFRYPIGIAAPKPDGTIHLAATGDVVSLGEDVIFENFRRESHQGRVHWGPTVTYLMPATYYAYRIR